MKQLLTYLSIIFFLTCSNTVYSITFAIQSLRVGPNPIIRNQNSLIINYVATLPHSANYYLYTTTGELIYKQTYATNTASITSAGECQFELINTATMASYPPQLYIVIMEFITEQETIRKKNYVILK